MFLDYLILVLFAGGMIAVGVITKQRTKSVNDFLLAGKKGLNGWMSAFSYGTTYFSSVIFIGYAGSFGRQFGLASVWIGIGNAIFGSFLAWLLLAKKTKNMTLRLGAKTMPEYFEKRYDSKNLRTFAAIIIFIFLIPYSASVYNGLSSLFQLVFGIPGYVVIIALAVLTAVYLFLGGYMATAISDFIQGLIMIVGVIIMMIFFLNKVNWDVSNLATDVNKTWFTFSGDSKGLYGNTVSLISLIILTSFGVYGLPQTVHKYYTVRDKKSIKQGMIVSTLFALLIGFSAYFVGSLSTLFSEEAVINASNDNVIPVMLKLVIPVGLLGLIATLILSASMSTLASVSLSSASVLAIDIYEQKIGKNAEDKKVKLIMRVACLVFVAISLTLALLNMKFNITAIAYMMGISWGTLAGCFIGPFVLGMYNKKVTKTAVWFSMVGTLILTAVLVVVLGYDKAGFDCTFGVALKNGVSCSPLIGVICMAYSLIITFVVSIFTKKPKEETIDKAFNVRAENEIA